MATRKCGFVTVKSSQFEKRKRASEWKWPKRRPEVFFKVHCNSKIGYKLRLLGKALSHTATMASVKISFALKLLFFAVLLIASTVSATGTTPFQRPRIRKLGMEYYRTVGNAVLARKQALRDKPWDHGGQGHPPNNNR